MKLTELQDVLGEGIRAITDPTKSDRERQKAYQNAEFVAKLAKQMINNADVILRSEKLIQEGKLKDSAIGAMIK